MSIRANSLAFRLIASAAAWSMLGLIAGGFLLSGIFRGAVEGSFDARLNFDLEGMVAVAEAETARTATLEDRFADPRFERIYSGWYWQIVSDLASADGVPAAPQTSRSLWDKTIQPGDIHTERGVSWGYAVGPDNQRLRVLARRITLPLAGSAEGDEAAAEEGTGDANGEAAPGADAPAGETAGSEPGRTPAGGAMYPFLFMVAGDLAAVEDDIARFNVTLLWSLGALGGVLIAAMVVQVRVGLVPLRRVSEALARIRAGRARRLEGEFPAEIAPLASELNSLIAHSAEVVGRARTHVANLAHFLKTPLTVLANEAAAEQGPLAETVARQVATMRRQVDHYLARARAAGALDVLGSRTEVAPVLTDLVRILKRMHPDKALDIALDAPGELAFKGERQDLEEMAGNLIDNACKWARGRVAVTVRAAGEGRIAIAVGDDGPGLAADVRERMLERGERLDETVPGSGLGLAIVRDVVKLYRGELVLGVSAEGGLEATLTLPAAA